MCLVAYPFTFLKDDLLIFFRRNRINYVCISQIFCKMLRLFSIHKYISSKEPMFCITQCHYLLLPYNSRLLHRNCGLVLSKIPLPMMLRPCLYVHCTSLTVVSTIIYISSKINVCLSELVMPVIIVPVG